MVVSETYINARDNGVPVYPTDASEFILNLVDRIAAARPTPSGVVLNGPMGAPIIFNGTFKVTRKIGVNLAQTRIMGTGKNCTFFVHDPTEDDSDGNVLFEFSKGDGSILQDCSIESLSIQSPNSSMVKTAIRFGGVDHFYARDVIVSQYGGNLDQSIGVHVKGRDFVELKGLKLQVDRPMVFSPTGFAYNGVADHFHCSDLYSICTDPNGTHVYLDPDVYLTHAEFDGWQSWCQGARGLYWDTSGGVTPGLLNGIISLSIDNLRTELNHNGLATSPGYSVFINGPTKKLLLKKCYSSIGAHGFSFDKVEGLIMTGCNYIETEGTPPSSKIALNIGDDCDLVLLNAFTHRAPSQKIISSQLVAGAGNNRTQQTYEKVA